MNRKIRKYRAIEYIILCYAAVLMLLIGPLGIFDGSREVSGNENVQGKTASSAMQPTNLYHTDL